MSKSGKAHPMIIQIWCFFMELPPYINGGKIYLNFMSSLQVTFSRHFPPGRIFWAETTWGTSGNAGASLS
jgi:hypothetical protein